MKLLSGQYFCDTVQDKYIHQHSTLIHCIYCIWLEDEMPKKRLNPIVYLFTNSTPSLLFYFLDSCLFLHETVQYSMFEGYIQAISILYRH